MRSVAVFVCLMLASQAWAKSKDQAKENEVTTDDEINVEGGYDKQAPQDPCYDKDCGIGHECEVDDDFKPVCICARACTKEVEDRAKVCSTYNETFDSECEFHRQKCVCTKAGRHGCEDAKYADMELDYFGPCKELGECAEYNLIEYPRRMREWLYLIMEELDNRDELSKKSSKMAKKALKMEKKWVIPVVWEFCLLDSLLRDDEIDFLELLPIAAPLKPMEACTAEFLDDCDTDRNGKISRWEWGKCLGVDTEDMEGKCEDFMDDL